MDAWVKSLLEWFNTHQRAMPWRSNPQPYLVWVSEIMLQQTQVDTVIPYFERFVSTFPTVESLASADQEDVLKLWEGLGYYSRARNLHKAAKLIVSDYDGQLPSDYKAMQKIPGIGPYCAAAIGSIAFGVKVPVVDGNVLRVFARFWGIEDDIANPKTRQILFDRLMPFIQPAPPSEFNQGIMELGALICTPKSPKCTECPLQRSCYANFNNEQSNLPVKTKKAPTPHYTIGIGVILKGRQILIAKRKEDQMLGGLWEFPGGKKKETETIEETVLREVKEETTLSVALLEPIAVVNHAYTHFKITMHAYLCEYLSGIEKPLSSDKLEWIDLNDLETRPFPTANKKIFPNLLKLLHSISIPI